MSTITVRNLDERTRQRLTDRAVANGRSMEAEVRAILAAATAPVDEAPLGSRIAALFADGLGEDPEFVRDRGDARAVAPEP